MIREFAMGRVFHSTFVATLFIHSIWLFGSTVGESHWQAWGSCHIGHQDCGYGKQWRALSDCSQQHGCYQSRTCHVDCKENGSWSTWSAFSRCSVTCGHGVMSRTRTCTTSTHLAASAQGDCQGQSTETHYCRVHHYCPINGGWSPWGEFSECSTSCGGGIKTRIRTCTHPAPRYGGLACPGKSHDTLHCNDHHCPINGDWSRWSRYSHCSVSCGGGTKTRFRSCSHPRPAYGGQTCHGSPRETLQCNDKDCPIDGQWGHWSRLTNCHVTCGGGIRYRYRYCNNPEPAHGGIGCPGNSRETYLCHTKHCPVDGAWSEWSAFSHCSVTCGGGNSTRSRSCSNPTPSDEKHMCQGEATQTTDCNSYGCPVNGGWSNWSSYFHCSVSCGGGNQTRTRSCTNPAPSHGGHNCVGKSVETATCNDHGCPINGGWGQWTSFTQCSKSCGRGGMSRSRLCNQPEPANGGHHCHGARVQLVVCNHHACPIDGGWSDWLHWGKCSVTCGHGITTRVRQCSHPAPAHGGTTCVGVATESQTCVQPHCPVDGQWSAWSHYSTCSKTCGGGTRTHQRTCSNPAPLHGGITCHGNDTETEICNQDPCPVDGHWNVWSHFSACSVTCGNGTTTRHRTCSNPAPLHGGKSCTGNETETVVCKKTHCPVDGEWSHWTHWRHCSVTCGQGIQKRVRHCSHPAPAHGGATCVGPSDESQTCVQPHCPVDGQWSAWSHYSTCSKTCGGGTRTHQRTCSNPAPLHGGMTCHGNDVETESCNQDPCQVDGNWSTWTPFSTCSKTCGDGIKSRNRTCSNPAPLHGGKLCSGTTTETVTCSDGPCPVDGGWSLWGSYSSCSVTCGVGIQKRERTCTEPVSQYGGTDCVGLSSETQNCTESECPVDGHWSQWSEFSVCSTSCGPGSQSRERTCTNPAPSNGGLPCAGNDNEVKVCETAPCKVTTPSWITLPTAEHATQWVTVGKKKKRWNREDLHVNKSGLLKR
ncbi:SCO-spondin-like isoform X2 [Crassostrea angulata]|nr:SCO-spondin-like isoform X2 [Crassostrea angulata]XP_052699212.1 SCO-spondin-like isoform X2 [Crassostrea angulata]